MNLRLDRDLVSYLGANRLKIDELFVIICLSQNNLDVLRSYLNPLNPDQCTAYMQSLLRKMIVRRLSPTEGFDLDNYNLTDIGHSIYSDITPHLVGLVETPVVLIEPELKLGELADEYLALFPDLKNAGGEKLRSNKTDVEAKLKTFMSKYKIRDKNLIIQSTQRYLDRMKTMNGYQYCACAMYFILKDGTSKLATECQSTKDNPGIDNAWEQLA